jgi:indolepyruvate ferredoxin oxidoreductase alpha subunit
MRDSVPNGGGQPNGLPQDDWWQTPRVSSEIDAATAFAGALVAGGVEFVTAFPGSPTTNLALYLERHGAQLGIEFRWAINENVALSQAFGAAMGGRGAAALMKHVGVNVASDALQVMGVVHGLAAPLLLIEGADAKPGSSQSAQDNRWLYASSPQLLVLAPGNVQEIVELVGDACAISTAAGMLVVVRGDARCFGASGSVAAPPAELAPTRARPFARWPERGFALATSARTYAHHLEQRRAVLRCLQPWIERRRLDFGLDGKLHLAVIVAAHLGAEIGDVIRARRLPGMRLTVEHPLPEAALLELAARVEELIVIEECTPTLEHAIQALVHRAGLRTKVSGRAALGDTRPIGRLGGESLEKLLDQVERRCPPGRRARTADELAPPRTSPTELLAGFATRQERERLALDAAHPASNFRADDPRRAMFAALRQLRPQTFIATDPGITGVLALAEHQCDVKMHMGCAVPIAAGWSRAQPGGLAVAVVGDTNLPHSEWLGLLDAADHRDDVLVVIADNGASEMTQRIVTPRLPPARAQASLVAAGIPCLTADLSHPRDTWAVTLLEAAGLEGPRVVWLTL